MLIPLTMWVFSNHIAYKISAADLKPNFPLQRSYLHVISSWGIIVFLVPGSFFEVFSFLMQLVTYFDSQVTGISSIFT